MKKGLLMILVMLIYCSAFSQESDYFIRLSGDTTYCKIKFINNGYLFTKIPVSPEKSKRKMVSFTELKSFRMNGKVTDLTQSNVQIITDSSFNSQSDSIITNKKMESVQLAGQSLKSASSLYFISVAVALVGGIAVFAVPTAAAGIAGIAGILIFVTQVVAWSEINQAGNYLIEAK